MIENIVIKPTLSQFNNQQNSYTNYLFSKFFCCFANNEAMQKRDAQYRVDDKNNDQIKNLTLNDISAPPRYSWFIFKFFIRQ